MHTYMLADMLLDLDMPSLAKDIVTQTSGSIIDGYIKQIEFKARSKNKDDIIERLYFAGLVY